MYFRYLRCLDGQRGELLIGDRMGVAMNSNGEAHGVQLKRRIQRSTAWIVLVLEVGLAIRIDEMEHHRLCELLASGFILGRQLRRKRVKSDHGMMRYRVTASIEQTDDIDDQLFGYPVDEAGLRKEDITTRIVRLGQSANESTSKMKELA